MTTNYLALVLVSAVAGIYGQQESVDMEGSMPLATSRQNAIGAQGLVLDNKGHSFSGRGFETEQIRAFFLLYP